MSKEEKPNFCCDCKFQSPCGKFCECRDIPLINPVNKRISCYSVRKSEVGAPAHLAMYCCPHYKCSWYAPTPTSMVLIVAGAIIGYILGIWVF